MMTRPDSTEPVTTQVPTPKRMPAGVEMRRWWKPTPDASTMIAHEQEIPVDEDGNPVGKLYVCPADECKTYAWTFAAEDQPDPACCPKHPEQLIPARVLPTDDDPIGSASRTARERWRAHVDVRKKRAAAFAQIKADAAREAASGVARRTHDDYKGHLPTAGIALGSFATEVCIAATAQPLLSASLGTAVATAGAVVAYVVVYILERQKIVKAGQEVRGRRARRARERARRALYAAGAAGVWLVLATGTGVDVRDPLAALALLLGALLIWATCHKTWTEISEARDSQREAARLAAEAAARRAQEEADRLRREAERQVEVVEVVEHQPETPEEMGEAMRVWWENAAHSEFAGTAFQQMKHTWIVPEKTKRVIVPIEGVDTPVGWQYFIQSKPGALVTRGISSGFVAPPLLAARDWIASMMGIQPELIELVDRPDRVQNTGAMIISTTPSLTSPLKYRGRAGIKVDPDGTISRLAGRAGNGVDVYEPMYIPGQPASGMTIGIPGAGKTVSVICRIMDVLFAGGLPTLQDPKMLVDFAYFIGLFPIGVTLEHRDVIMRTKMAERARRQKVLARQRREATARVHARRRGEPVPPRTGRPDNFYDTSCDGLLFGSFWEEFHMINDDRFVKLIGQEQRLQRAIAMFDHLISQDGGLGDFKDGAVRAMFQASGLHVFRTPINRARLAGYSGDYDPASMPPIPGLESYDTGGGAVQVIRTPYLDPREEAEGGLFDTLWGPNGELLLEVAPIPDPMMEVLEREGLMDLWRLGQGEHGLDNLLAGTEPVRDAPTGAQVAGTDGRSKTEARDVFLALIGQNPGCTRRFVVENPIWFAQAGWDREPNPSTITRAVRRLKGFEEGEIEGRDKPSLPVLITGDAGALYVTDAGAPLAAKLWTDLSSRPSLPTGPAASEGAPTADDGLTDEQRAERNEELRQEAELVRAGGE
ncbi:hypothetical protein I0C86_40705 [Plantactinospora sp. S1510]|uniref:FtsK domain-containing protein n=1 Tax=Plantactinospora alkalitolerans TaxID=2789879 RepID=A0ABS0H9Q1_9ACTN|nr:hypothetical protein [Plantactinospora alkalitolerans]MBF9135202.1 hypothetical protein [Plantactinospora alkalitolerans]